MSLPLCGADDCKTCMYIHHLKEPPRAPTVAACFASIPYKEDKELPISYPLCNNSAVWQKFCRIQFRVTNQFLYDACNNHCSQQRFSQNPLRQHGAVLGVLRLRIRLSYHVMPISSCRRGRSPPRDANTVSPTLTDSEMWVRRCH